MIGNKKQAQGSPYFLTETLLSLPPKGTATKAQRRKKI